MPAHSPPGPAPGAPSLPVTPAQPSPCSLWCPPHSQSRLATPGVSFCLPNLISAPPTSPRRSQTQVSKRTLFFVPREPHLGRPRPSGCRLPICLPPRTCLSLQNQSPEHSVPPGLGTQDAPPAPTALPCTTPPTAALGDPAATGSCKPTSDHTPPLLNKRDQASLAYFKTGAENTPEAPGAFCSASGEGSVRNKSKRANAMRTRGRGSRRKSSRRRARRGLSSRMKRRWLRPHL